MRNLKKFLALVLAMLMVVSAAATVSAFEDVAEDNALYAAITKLDELGIVKGMTDEEFGIDTNVKRFQAAIMFARALTAENGVVKSDDYWNQGPAQFADVTEYQYAITVAVNAGIINGAANPDGTITFNPQNNITYVQALKMAVCALGLGEGVEWGVDGLNFYNVADACGLTKNVNYITDLAQELTRGEFAQIIYNMIYAEYYDADLDKVTTIAKENFDDPKDPEPEVEPVVENATTYIITATNKQAAYADMEITEGEIVGMQALVNGAPSGKTVYVAIADLGLAEDADIEDYFLYAFDLVTDQYGNFLRYDLKTEADDTWMIFDAQISGESTAYNRFTYESKNYYMVDAKTGDAYKNEVVVYTTDDLDSNATKELYMNKNDQVLHPTENVPVLEKVVSASGNVRYRVLVEDEINGVEVIPGEYITEAQAIALYGVAIKDAELPYSIMDAADLKGKTNYALIVFDDDGDQKMDRAYYTDVYMTMLPADISKIDSKDTSRAPISSASKFADETYAKDTIITYTYNAQTNEINVLDASVKGTGVVESINTRYKNTDKKFYSTITLEDGTILTVYNTDPGKKTVAGIGNDFGATADTTVAFAKDDDILKKINEGDTINYAAFENIVISAASVEETFFKTYQRVTLKEVLTVEEDAIIADFYNEKGDVVEYAINTLEMDGKVIEVADYTNWIKLSTILGDFAKLDREADVYRLYGNDAQGYYLDADVELSAQTAANAESKFGLYDVTLLGDALVIEENVSVDADGVLNTDDRANRLRTNEDTVWIFIDTTANTVKTFSGDLEYAEIEFKTAQSGTILTKIYANKLGYTGTQRGVASVVYVIDSAELVGFNGTQIAESIVYLGNVDKTLDLYDFYVMGSAKKFGLDAEKYTSKNYFEYESVLAVDMYTGENVTLYADYELDTNTFYLVDENNVVVDEYAYLIDDGNGNLVADRDGDDAVIDGGLILNTELYVYEFRFDEEYFSIYDGNEYTVHPSWDIDDFVVVRYDNVKKAELDDDQDIWKKYDKKNFVDNFNTNTGLPTNGTVAKGYTDGSSVNAYVIAGPLMNDDDALYADPAGKYYDADGKYVIIVGNGYTEPEDEVVTNTNEKTIDFNATCAYGGNTYVANFTNKSENAKRIDGVITAVKKATTGLEWGTEVKAELDAMNAVYTVASISIDGTAVTGLDEKYDITVTNNAGTLNLKMTNVVNTPFDSKDLAKGEYTIVLNDASATTIITIYVKIA